MLPDVCSDIVLFLCNRSKLLANSRIGSWLPRTVKCKTRAAGWLMATDARDVHRSVLRSMRHRLIVCVGCMLISVVRFQAAHSRCVRIGTHHWIGRRQTGTERVDRWKKSCLPYVCSLRSMIGTPIASEAKSETNLVSTKESTDCALSRLPPANRRHGPQASRCFATLASSNHSGEFNVCTSKICHRTDECPQAAAG